MISAGQKVVNLANKTLANPTAIDFYTRPHYALIIYFVVWQSEQLKTIKNGKI